MIGDAVGTVTGSVPIVTSTVGSGVTVGFAVLDGGSSVVASNVGASVIEVLGLTVEGGASVVPSSVGTIVIGVVGLTVVGRASVLAPNDGANDIEVKVGSAVVGEGPVTGASTKVGGPVVAMCGPVTG